ncbi:hypothetical protein VPH35_089195 [Triticum aestivum]
MDPAAKRHGGGLLPSCRLYNVSSLLSFPPYLHPSSGANGAAAVTSSPEIRFPSQVGRDRCGCINEVTEEGCVGCTPGTAASIPAPSGHFTFCQ